MGADSKASVSLPTLYRSGSKLCCLEPPLKSFAEHPGPFWLPEASAPFKAVGLCRTTSNNQGSLPSCCRAPVALRGDRFYVPGIRTWTCCRVPHLHKLLWIDQLIMKIYDKVPETDAIHQNRTDCLLPRTSDLQTLWLMKYSKSSYIPTPLHFFPSHVFQKCFLIRSWHVQCHLCVFTIPIIYCSLSSYAFLKFK